MIFFTEWFQIQKGFATPFDEISPLDLNKIFSLSEKTRRTAVITSSIPNGDRRCVGLSLILRSPPFSKPFSFFVYTYLTVLEYTKSVASGGYLPRRFAAR